MIVKLEDVTRMQRHIDEQVSIMHLSMFSPGVGGGLPWGLDWNSSVGRDAVLYH